SRPRSSSSPVLCPLPYSHTFSSRLPYFFLTNPAPTLISTLSLHDALPICSGVDVGALVVNKRSPAGRGEFLERRRALEEEHLERSEEHTSELQSRFDLVCRLLLEKKKKKKKIAREQNQKTEE